MEKKSARRAARSEKNPPVLRKSGSETSEVLTTITHCGKTERVERWHIAGMTFSPKFLAFSEVLDKEHEAAIELKLEALRSALTSDATSLQDEAHWGNSRRSGCRSVSGQALGLSDFPAGDQHVQPVSHGETFEAPAGS